MRSAFTIVDGCVPTGEDDTNVRDEVISFALDQRAFGARQLMIAFADRDGRFRGLAWTERTDPPDVAFEACMEYMGRGSAAAVAFCDERVEHGPPPHGSFERLDHMRTIAADFGVYLVDWISCDDQLFRCTRLGSLGAETTDEWWTIP